jgi:hypothetical protein
MNLKKARLDTNGNAAVITEELLILDTSKSV